MPLTFAHPAAVLPFGKLSKRWVSLTALVAGSMAPDFEYFIWMRLQSQHSHSWVSLWRFELPVGLAVFFTWQYVVKRPLIDHLPAVLNKRLSAFRDSPLVTFSYLPVIVYCILIGAATHLFWDSFTHPHRYFVMRMAILQEHITIAGHAVYGYKLLQHTSTLAGLTAIVWVIVRLPQVADTRKGNTVVFWLSVCVVMILTLIIRLMTGLTLHQYGNIIVSAISGSFIGLILMSMWFRRQKSVV